MKRTLLTLALLAATSTAYAGPWTYQGTLNDGGKLANGTYDVRVTLLDKTKTTNVSSPITFYSVDVVDGNFSVDVDFGIDLTSAAVMALKTEVQQGGSGFVSLGEPTQFDPKASLAGVCWDTLGNGGTVPGDFIGTTDYRPLSLRANNSSALRIFPSVELSSGRSITHNMVGGSSGNGVIEPARGATIAGGGSVNGADPDYTVGGSNRIDDNYGTIGGGFDNQAGTENATATDGAFATVGGGYKNLAAGSSSVVSGGKGNVASGTFSTISGGTSNDATGFRSVVSGGSSNCAGGDNSWVGGNSAKTRVGNGVDDGTCAPSSGDSDGDEGSFVWADRSSSADFVSSGANQFIVRAANGVGINTSDIGTGNELTIQSLSSSADIRLVTASGKDVRMTVSDTSGGLVYFTNPTPGSERIRVFGSSGGSASLSAGGTWTNASSRSYKENFTAVNGSDVLSRLVALPIMTWDYIGSAEGLHMGPVAEDFKESFGLAGDGKSISTVDADGIALAAIQGLNAKLETENGALRARLDALEARLQ